MVKEKIIVSACLMGVNCRYDGKSKTNTQLKNKLNNFEIIEVCPETLGNLPTPRLKAQIENGGSGEEVLNNTCRVLNSDNIDITKNFIDGAFEVLKLIKTHNIKRAYLKDKSPSCGVNNIYINDKVVKGMGVTTALLIKNKVTVISID